MLVLSVDALALSLRILLASAETFTADLPPFYWSLQVEALSFVVKVGCSSKSFDGAMDAYLCTYPVSLWMLCLNLAVCCMTAN